MIKVLIVEDEIAGLGMAKAGLIPFRENETDEIDSKYRIKLAGENYLIENCKSIKDALEKIKSFNPDLAIIDIDLKEKSGANAGGKSLNTGIDFFRYLDEQKNPVTEKILFSSAFGTPKFYNQLKEREKQHFIPKATSGVGFEILSNKISEYLKRVAKNILKETLPKIKSDIQTDISTKSFDDISEYPYQFGKRKIKAKHFMMFCSYPIEESKNKKTFITLGYDKPLQALESLLNQGDQISDAKTFRAEWAKKHMQNAIIYYHANMSIEHEKKITECLKQMLDKLCENIEKEAASRLNNFKLKNFSPVSYRTANLKDSENFRNKFLNSLKIRRLQIFIELFNQEYNDKQNGSSWKSYYGGYFKNFVSENFQAIKRKSNGINPDQLSQYGDMLNFSFELGSRESVNLNANALLDCEEEWFQSKEYAELKTAFYNKAKR